MIDRLLEIASNSLGADVSPQLETIEFIELNDILSVRNGFFAYEGSLLFRPVDNVENLEGLIDWNSVSLWKGLYSNPEVDEHFFFAENIFGEQFSIKEGSIFQFYPETAEFEPFASSFGEWAKKIISEPDFITGHQIAHLWQSENGALKLGERLAPSLPFVLGGDYDLSNLKRTSDIDLIRFRAQLANQIQDLPDGAEIKIDLI